MTDLTDHLRELTKRAAHELRHLGAERARRQDPRRRRLAAGVERSGLPARFWVAVLPAGGTPPQTVHEVRSYGASGRELCRLDPDTPTPRGTG